MAPTNRFDRLQCDVTRQRIRVFLYSNWKYHENKSFALKIVYKMEKELWGQVKEAQH